MSGFIHWLEDHLLTCPYKAGLGMECPGCGFQRAFIELIQGNVAESLALYPALIPMLVMFGLLGLHIKFSFRYGALALKILFVLNVVLIMGSWVAKML